MSYGIPGFKLADQLITAFLADDQDAAIAVVAGIDADIAEALIYLAQQFVHLWEQSCTDPVGEWAEMLMIRAAGSN